MKPKFNLDGSCICGHSPQPQILAPGYGVRKDGSTHCIDCLTEAQKDALCREGVGTLILRDGTITNAPGTLTFSIIRSEAAGHNIAAIRTDVWFNGPDDMLWQGTRYGEGNGSLRVKRCTGLQHLRAQLQAYGMTIYMTDGEYRVNYRFGKPETTYYTNDPVDAFNTALRMAEERDAPQPIDMSAFG